ncbi:MAG TPA: HEXXH motif-containing putative peptide modification protein, partial [Dongiaceae bacterium]
MPAVTALIRTIEAGHRLPPLAFALYYDLVPELLAGNEAKAGALFAELGRQMPIGAPLRILSLDDPAMHDRAERYLRYMSDGEAAPIEFIAPPAKLAAAFRSQFADAIRLIDKAAPALLGELRAIVSEIILVVAPPEAKIQFDGGSAYRLWGALFTNADRCKTRIDVVEILAHEGGHSLVFGLCTEEAPVLNPEDELFPSPLRPEPRPMEGVYHATFVSARMHWAMSRLIESGLLTEEEYGLAAKARDDDRANFESGYQTVAAHARLSDTGRRAIEAAR